MSFKEFLDAIVKYITDYINQRFTGKIVFTINFREGGIANVKVEVEHELKKQ